MEGVIDGVIVGAMTCGLGYAAVKLFKLEYHWVFYMTVHGNFGDTGIRGTESSELHT